MHVYNRVPESPPLADILGALRVATRSGSATTGIEEFFRDVMGFGRFEQYGSGRQALARALSMAGSTGEVVVPAYGCPIVEKVVRAVGLHPVFADIEPGRFHVSAREVLSRVSSATVAVVVVHEFGNPVPRAHFESLRSNFSGAIIEDCAVALGARYADGTRAGVNGDLVVFSGSLGKPVGAAAWGGLGIRLPSFAGHSDSFPAQSSLRSLLRLGALKILDLDSVYELARPGLARAVASDSTAANVAPRAPSGLDVRLILGRLQRLDEEAVRRWSIAKRIYRCLEEHGMQPMSVNGNMPMTGRLPFYVSRSTARDAVIAAFGAAGIELSIPFQHNFSGASPHHLAMAADAVERVLCLSYKESVDRADFWSRLKSAAAAAGA